jgi:hypothetical protein
MMADFWDRWRNKPASTGSLRADVSFSEYLERAGNDSDGQIGDGLRTFSFKRAFGRWQEKLELLSQPQLQWTPFLQHLITHTGISQGVVNKE